MGRKTPKGLSVYVALVCALGLPALALGGVFLVLALRLRTGERRRAAFAFHYSLLYLALLFAAAAVDVSL